MTNRRFPTRRRSRGAALLVALVPVLLLAGGATLPRIESGARGAHRIEDERSRRALVRAKEALIHYALTDGNRPGELPCPDLDGDGRLRLNVDFRGGANVPCATLRGWLPFHTLGTGELRDGAGERLWYAVSDVHHSGHSTALNSELAGQLRMGDAGDVVAVLIAPGPPVDERQARERAAGASGPDARRLASAFLEGDNAGADPARYASQGHPRRGENDRVLPLLRRELMTLVERRVLGEVAEALQTFHREHGTLPWLAPLNDPEAAPLAAEIGTRRGRLAFQRTGDRIESDALHARWELDELRKPNGSAYVPWAWGSVERAALRSGDHRFLHGPGPSGRPECRVTHADAVDCRARETLTRTCRGIAGTEIRRTYRLRVKGVRVESMAPDEGHRRRRAVSVHRRSAPGPVASAHRVHLSIEDLALSGPRAGDRCGRGSLKLTGSGKGYIEVGEIRHPFELGSELPAWFVDERWHALTYAAYAGPLAPSAAPGPCEPDVDCLVLEGVHPRADKPAVVIIAGAALPGQERGAWSAGAYFERHNTAPGDDRFTARAPPEEFNDQVRVLTLSP